MFDINTAFSKKSIFFQCTHKVPVSQRTVHIIAHHRKLKNHLAVYDHLQSWVPGHLYWIQHVGQEMLTETGLKVEEFANKIISPKVPIAELGFLVIARMYHTHFGVVLKDRVWYMTDDNTAVCSKFMLMYQGGVSFSDTCTGNWDHPSPPPLILVLDEEQPQQKSPVNLARPHVQKATNNCASMLPLDMRNNRGIKGHEKSDEEPNMD